jgi:hypothetical protein
MTCQRCKKLVPDGLLACPCFAAAAEEETLTNAATYFKSGLVVLSMTAVTYGKGTNPDPNERHGGHVLTPGRGRTLCGERFRRERYVTVTYDSWMSMNHCAKCEAEINRRASS